ncbi:hypothetical protein [Chitinophaga sp. MM2321]|uniref:carboxylesterase family protein n=1 Tax=Chitinophaga sp. MM2321 TaxID=3137178 RepID=UPI0032D5879B
MKKHIILLLFFAAFSIQINAQSLIGNQTPILVKTASYGATQNALLSLPDDYNVTNDKYPLIIFLHGYGEIGSGVAGLKNLIGQGLPQVIANGNKIQAVDPATGKLTKFIVISPQHWAWTTAPDAIDFMLSDLPKSYRIDTDRIYLTGLSSGGQGVIQAVTYSQGLLNKLAAIIPMSPSAPDEGTLKKFSFFKEAKTSAWFFSGASDPGNMTDNARRYNDSINKYSPGASKLTLYPGGHCCWADIYNPSHKENGVSMYEWLLTKVKGGAITEPPVVTPPVDTVPVITRKLISVIRVYDNNGVIEAIPEKE